MLRFVLYLAAAIVFAAPAWAADLVPVPLRLDHVRIESGNPNQIASGSGTVSLNWSSIDWVGTGTTAVSDASGAVVIDLSGSLTSIGDPSATSPRSYLGIYGGEIGEAMQLSLTVPDVGDAMTPVWFKFEIVSATGTNLRQPSSFYFVFSSSDSFDYPVYESSVLGGLAALGYVYGELDDDPATTTPMGFTVLQSFIPGDEVTLLSLALDAYMNPISRALGAAYSFEGQFRITAFVVDPTGGEVADADADGVPNAFDNCIDQPNGTAIADPGGSIQRDTSGSGFGNMCDCDFDNSGSCNADDFNLFLPDFAAGTDSGIGSDMNGDGVVNANDLNLFLPLFAAGQSGPSGHVP